MANSARMQRVSDEIQKILVRILQRHAKDPRLKWVTVTAVEVSKDLSFAKVYYSSLSNDYNNNDVEKALIKSSGFFKTCLSKEISTRVAPGLKFILDTSTQYGQKMESLISKARNSDREFIKDSEPTEESLNLDNNDPEKKKLR
jgi:ribosome-binding factor A